MEIVFQSYILILQVLSYMTWSNGSWAYSSSSQDQQKGSVME